MLYSSVFLWSQRFLFSRDSHDPIFWRPCRSQTCTALESVLVAERSYDAVSPGVAWWFSYTGRTVKTLTSSCRSTKDACSQDNKIACIHNRNNYTENIYKQPIYRRKFIGLSWTQKATRILLDSLLSIRGASPAVTSLLLLNHWPRPSSMPACSSEGLLPCSPHVCCYRKAAY